MIPVLYDAKETDFSSNGIGYLTECISCSVTEERNGIYECDFQYPVTGYLYNYLNTDCIVKAKPNDKSDEQLFRIYASSKPINGIVTYNCEHISYELKDYPIRQLKLKGRTAASAISAVLSNTVIANDYTSSSDVGTLHDTTLELVSARSALGGVEGSILDVWGGEFEWDNRKVILHKQRGSDTGIIVAYGKNLTDINQEYAIDETYTALYPYAKYTDDDNVEHTVTLSEGLLYSKYKDNYSHAKTLIMDFSQSFADDEEINETNLRKYANQYVANSGFDEPNINITVSFNNLSQMAEDDEHKILEQVGLCDTLRVFFDKLGIDVKAKVVKTVYDTISEKYTSIELGNAKTSLIDTINQTNKAVEKTNQTIKQVAIDNSKAIASAVKNATDKITGQSGGYVVLNPAENPQEILIMDAPTIDDAVNLWRFNSGGLGHSSSGYNGDYETAITMDGQIVANRITAGELDGAILKSESVSANAIEAGFKETIQNNIDAKAEEISQKFKVADAELVSTIAQSTQQWDTGSVPVSIFGYGEPTEDATEHASEFYLDQTNGYLYFSNNGVWIKAKECNSYTENLSTKIQQNADNITLKVSKNDLGTEIQQNYSSVKIAWNSISKNIQFENACMNIYDGTGDSKKLITSFTSEGTKFYCNDNSTSIGKIGTNNWEGYESYKGLVFDLENSGSYMCWAHRDNKTDTLYTVKLAYHATSQVVGDKDDAIHLGCNFYANGYEISSANLTDVRAGGYAAVTRDVTLSYTSSLGRTRNYTLKFKNGILIGVASE